MKHIILGAAFLAAACATAPMPTGASCLPAGADRAQIDALKAADWVVSSDSTRNAMAIAMVACVASPESPLREASYEALQHWMRAGTLSRETLLTIGDDLQRRLKAPEGDGFERPFAALVLAEWARTDRVHPWLAPAQRATLLDASVAYLTQVRDYRGFDDREGWRHGVAHGGDLMVQLALNPAFGKPELTRIRDAVATQISPSAHFYIYGESERLAAPVIYLAQRGVFTEAEWTVWLDQISASRPLPSWNDAFSRNGDIARVQNTKAFLQAIYLYASLDETADDDTLLPGARAALRRLP